MASLELEARLDNLLATAQAETANIDLFAPLIDREDCPICMIPLPHRESGIRFMTCCGKNICIGCDRKHTDTEIKKGVTEIKKKGARKIELKCAFCCQTLPKNTIKALKKLTKKNNPSAIIQIMACEYRSGEMTLQSNTKALELLICAAELGCTKAYELIGKYYEDGIALEQNMSRALEFNEVAAKKGSMLAHLYLAIFHGKSLVDNESVLKGIDHMKVAASAGCQEAMDMLLHFYKHELVTKEEMTQALRAFQASDRIMKWENKDPDDDLAKTLRKYKVSK